MLQISWEVFAASFVVISTIAGWFLSLTRRNANQIADMKADIAAYKLEASEKYAHMQALLHLEERFTVTGDKLIARMDYLSQTVSNLTGRLEAGGLKKSS